MADEKTEQEEPTVEVELDVSFGGVVGGVNSPRQGDKVKLTETQATSFEEKGFATRVKAKRTTKKATKKVETAKGESGPEKRS